MGDIEKGRPDVSVVIATRDRRAMLAEAMESVVAQTRVHWELLVVDDASTDDTWAYLDSRREVSVRCFRQESHAERSAARNLGLAHARGRYVMFLDDDDNKGMHHWLQLAPGITYPFKPERYPRFVLE